MARTGTGQTRRGEPTLTAADWAEAALQLVAECGLAGLTVDALARRLGVTKGSFYWHYAGRAELLAAALERWEQRATTEAIRSLDAVDDPRRRLELMLGAASQPPRSRSLYAALSGAAGDPVVAPVLARVGARRIAYLEQCYRGIGHTAAAAKARALAAYAAYRGLLQLAHEGPDGAAGSAAEWRTYAEAIRQAFVPDRPPGAQRRAGASRRRSSSKAAGSS